MTKQDIKESGFTVGGGATGASIVPGPVDTGSVKRAADKQDGDKTADKVADVTPQAGGTVSADGNRASVAAKGDPTSVKTQAMENIQKIKDIFTGQELSEEMLDKTVIIFEAAVSEHVAGIRTQLEEEYATKIEDAVKVIKEEVDVKLDEYVDYVAGKWLEDNKIAVESGIRSEVTESFMVGLRDLFIEHNINIPEEKADVVEQLVSKVEDLETRLNASINENIELKKVKEAIDLEGIVEELQQDMTDTQKEKFSMLIENISFETKEQFADKAKVIKETYITAATTKKAVTLTESKEQDTPLVEADVKTVVTDPNVARFADAIKRTTRK